MTLWLVKISKVKQEDDFSVSFRFFLKIEFTNNARALQKKTGVRMIIVSNLPMLITRKLDFILDWAIHAPNFKPRRQIIKDSTRKVQTQAVWTTK